jgi:predicted  nucleic acid-binding Zn-ribbon protein
MGASGTNLEAIKSKITELGEQKQKLEKELADMKASYDGLKSELGDQKQQMDDLAEKNKVLKVAKSLNESGGSSTETKLKINELVREIDKCIALLNK